MSTITEVSSKRLLKYINIIIGIALVAATAVVCWYGWRPLPQTSGTVPAPITEKASAARDSLGVAHIIAASQDDALFLHGYVTAQDRLWQMDLLRRLAAGDVAEMIGAAGLETDREARRLRIRRIAEQAYLSLPPHDRAVLTAYARGVNYFIETHRGNLPIEFRLLRYDPRPWSVVDSIAIGLHMFRTLTTTWSDEILKRSMLSAGEPGKVDFLLPVRSGSEQQPGSNAWALAGARTASGKPILANDMHMEFSIPGIWHMAHIQAPGLNVSGVCIPGVPGVIVGHNDRIAWGVTSLHFDVQDLYLERFDNRTGRYLFRGQTEQARLERDVIRVKGSSNVEMLTWVTRHGPLYVSEGADRMSLKWLAAETGGFQFPFIEINRARNWSEFLKALARFPGPAQNFVYADVDGNIGYHVAGKLPIRKTYSGDVPVDGSGGNFEWEGYIPFDQLPSAFNPPDGMIVTANQNPFPPDYPYKVHGNFASHYRSKQIRDLLSARKGWKAEDMIALQKDVYSPFSHYLATALVAAYDSRQANHPALADAIATLRRWNGQMEKDQSAPLIVTLAYQHLRRAVGDRASPGKGAAYDIQMAPPAIETLLRTRPPAWFDDYDLLLLRSLMDALEEGRRIQGSDLRKWTYGNYLAIQIHHPVGRGLPILGKYFSLGPAPMSGSATTIKQTTRRLGPSMRMSADLADWDRSLLNLPLGQSGQVLSKHYKDQWQAYYTGASFPMQFKKVEAKAVLRFEPQ